MPPDYFDAHFREPGWEHRTLTVVPPPALPRLDFESQFDWLRMALAYLLAEAPRPGPCELVAAPASIVGAPPGVALRLWWPPAPDTVEYPCSPPPSSN